MCLRRAGTSEVRVHTSERTSETDSKGFFKHVKHAIVTFLIDDIEEASVDGFNKQNVISSIEIARDGESIKLGISGIYGADAQISAKGLRLKLQPGNPRSA